MQQSLPNRPNLSHLREQAKDLLSSFKSGDSAARRRFIESLPEGARLSPQEVETHAWTLADAQSVVAREYGFLSWERLLRHVQELGALEGTWSIVTLQVDGNDVPETAVLGSTVTVSGDVFLVKSWEATYEGLFTVDAAAEPKRIDIEFFAGPEKGNVSYGIYVLDGDEWTICLGLTGAERPLEFVTAPGRGHALETLRRLPTGVEPSEPVIPPEFRGTPPGTAGFESTGVPSWPELHGEWKAVSIQLDGMVLPDFVCTTARRVASEDNVKVTVGGQVVIDARVSHPGSGQIDYALSNGGVLRGLFEWDGARVRFCLSAPDADRPTEFTAEKGSGRTLSLWERV